MSGHHNPKFWKATFHVEFGSYGDLSPKFLLNGFGMMPDVDPLYKEQDVFRNIGCVVGKPFKTSGNENVVNAGMDSA